MSDIENIIGFWLDDVGPKGWYEVNKELDERIRSDFGGLWQQANDGGLADWRLTARGTLAFLILTDQFPRNMFRGTAEAFSTDGLARRTAKTAIARGLNMETAEPERHFFNLPIMHSESLEDQEHCIRLILLTLPETGRNGPLEHAIKHREVIRRFGRFPSRNAALGRTDSDAELAYRAEGGYMS